MDVTALFPKEQAGQALASYEAFINGLFACVDHSLCQYLDAQKSVFAQEGGGYKNVLYPDLELACDQCANHLHSRLPQSQTQKDTGKQTQGDAMPADLLDLFAGLMDDQQSQSNLAEGQTLDLEQTIAYLMTRGGLSDVDATPMPLYSLMAERNFDPFTMFALACALLSATQTSYASVFQVVNQNGSLSVPTIESAARVYYGQDFSITRAYREMSTALEQLRPILAMQIRPEMPFSTALSPDKRLVDFLFGSNPLRPDETYQRFIANMDLSVTQYPFLANQQVLDAINISYEDGGRIFALSGDEGSGRKFTLAHFCTQKNARCVTLNCVKLFLYDFSFVERALWSLTRECILTGSVCALSEISYREDEKDKFFGYMDLAFEKLLEYNITIFALSKESLPMREITTLDCAQLDLPTPSNAERQSVWRYYGQSYKLGPDISLEEVSTKFLFTPGKIKSALHQARSLSAMAKEILISRASLFKACNMQMSHELTQKATRIEANFGWDDIVMSPDQRLALENACNQLTYRKTVYDDWNYTKKYPYGRGLSVLLFGAPGTGKSMCAQVIAHEMNLELYRVDLSKVVDKYVGETEKSISMIFREAKKCNVVLFFDECDTLFAKRSDDGGSGQSSNNNKTALLLQEVEAYDGVSVLATNYKHNIDPAFFRRMKFIVEFQFPDVQTRKILWNATIPKNTPLAEDVDVDFLASRFEFVGGNIKNCILNAAFLAAADPTADGEVHMRHYLQAIKYEFVKTGKVFTRADFEPYAHMVL